MPWLLVVGGQVQGSRLCIRNEGCCGATSLISVDHVDHINALCWKNFEFVSVALCNIYSYHWALKFNLKLEGIKITKVLG